MPIYRTKIRWSGFTGAPGYSILHFDASTDPTVAGAQDVYNQTVAFCSDIASNLPSVVSVLAEGAVEVINTPNGDLLDILPVTPSPAAKGIQTGGFSAATGACITWETGEVKNGRRVRGRTFIVPMTAALYDTDGTLTSGALTDLQNAAGVLAGSGFSFGIYSRPSSAEAEDGSFHTVSSGRVSDKTAVLRSRRD